MLKNKANVTTGSHTYKPSQWRSQDFYRGTHNSPNRFVPPFTLLPSPPPPPTRKKKSSLIKIERRSRKILDDNKAMKSFKSLSALFQTLPILFHFISCGKSWRNFLQDRIYCYLSFEKESDNFCVMLTYSIKWARKIRKFHVVVVKRRQRNVQKCVMHVLSCCFSI